MAQPSATPSEDQQLKQRALRRLAIALGLIAAAIVGLALLDRYTSPGKRPLTEKPATEPPPIAALPAPKPVRPAPEAAGPPSAAPAPAMPPPPPPVVSNVPLAPAAVKPVPAAPEQPVVPEGTAGAGKGPPQAAGARAPPPAGAKPAPVQAPAPAAERIKGFVVQTGVFSSHENAVALQSKLQEQGIPSFLETRVVVGPFRNRAEADAATKRLRALGLSGLVSQRK
jgi:cell division septation protein DedD